MSALRHGFFRRGFMHCDRCAWNGHCDRFRPGKACSIEEKAFEWVVEELTREYGLDGVADRLLAERAAMVLIRIARVEAYEAAVGISDDTALLGRYIERLDRMLLKFLEALAVTRTKRLGLRRGEALSVGVTELLKGLKARSRPAKPRRVRIIVDGRWTTVRFSPWKVYAELLGDWMRELEELEEDERSRGG